MHGPKVLPSSSSPLFAFITQHCRSPSLRSRGAERGGKEKESFFGLGPAVLLCCFGSLWHYLHKRQGRVGGFAFWTACLESKGCMGDAARGCKRFGTGAFEE